MLSLEIVMIFFPDVENSHSKHIYINCLNNFLSSTLGIRPDWDNKYK